MGIRIIIILVLPRLLTTIATVILNIVIIVATVGAGASAVGVCVLSL